jgi:hypothetical protein
LQRLPDSLNDPMLVYISPGDKKAHAIVTSIATSQGPVTAYFTQRVRDGVNVLEAKTVFGKDAAELLAEAREAESRGLVTLKNKGAFDSWIAQNAGIVSDTAGQHTPAIEGLSQIFQKEGESQASLSTGPTDERLSKEAEKKATDGMDAMEGGTSFSMVPMPPEVRGKFEDFVKNSIADRQYEGEFVIRQTTDKEVAEILRQGGPDVTGLSHSISALEVRHAFNRHGDPEVEQRMGQRVLTENDIPRFLDVIDAPDSIVVKPSTKANRTKINYSKHFPDGTIVVAERVIETSKRKEPRLLFRTAWVESSVGVKSSTAPVSTPGRQGTNATEERGSQATGFSLVPGEPDARPTNFFGASPKESSAKSEGDGRQGKPEIFGEQMSDYPEAAKRVASKAAGERADGALDVVAARDFYLEKDDHIDTAIEHIKAAGGSLEQMARAAFEIRNAFRTKARDMMANRRLAKSLEDKEPNLTWEQVVEKYGGDYHLVIIKSKESRKSVDERIERLRNSTKDKP